MSIIGNVTGTHKSRVAGNRFRIAVPKLSDATKSNQLLFSMMDHNTMLPAIVESFLPASRGYLQVMPVYQLTPLTSVDSRIPTKTIQITDPNRKVISGCFFKVF